MIAHCLSVQSISQFLLWLNHFTQLFVWGLSSSNRGDDTAFKMAACDLYNQKRAGDSGEDLISETAFIVCDWLDFNLAVSYKSFRLLAALWLNRGYKRVFWLRLLTGHCTILFSPDNFRISAMTTISESWDLIGHSSKTLPFLFIPSIQCSFRCWTALDSSHMVQG